MFIIKKKKDEINMKMKFHSFPKEIWTYLGLFKA